MKLIREINEDYKIKSLNDNLKYLSEFKKEDREFFIVLGLDTANKVLYRDIVSIGTLNMLIVHPREVFKSAILKSANSIILAHNHPSGSIEPSAEDLEIHKRLIDSGELLNIKVLDCLIITPKGLTSFMETIRPL
jgi:DNA repair protein RadC